MGLSARSVSGGPVDALRFDEYGNPAFCGHHAVVLVPIVVGAAGGDEDVAQQKAKAFSIDPVERVVGTHELNRALHAYPLPTGADHDGGAGTGPEVAQPPRRSG